MLMESYHLSVFASIAHDYSLLAFIDMHLSRLPTVSLYQFFAPFVHRKDLDLCRLLGTQTSLYSIKKTRTHCSNHREMSHCSKILVSKNELRETDNIGARDLDALIANFLLQEREFFFLICVKKTISMKIPVLCVINSSRHRNCSVRGYIHCCFCQKPSLARTSLVRVFPQTTRGYNRPRTYIYKLYIYIYGPTGGHFCLPDRLVKLHY